jgi:hypothetical protein
VTHDHVLGPLAATAYTTLRAFFVANDHHPSTEQWAAITDLLRHLEMAANGKVEEAVYVSAIPAGTGKSQSLRAFASALCSSPAHAHVGMLILVNRVEEIQDMADKLEEHRSKLCIIVGRDNAYKVAGLASHAEADQAQVCLSTQAALKEALKVPFLGFAGAERFHYKGQRRAVVCWDEAIAFRRPVVLNQFGVGSLMAAMARQSLTEAQKLATWVATLGQNPEERVPYFTGIDFPTLEEATAKDDDLQAQAVALGVAQGETVMVRRDNFTGMTLVSHVPEIPASLQPVFVTDASAAEGVNHESYVQMNRNSSLRIIPLLAAKKTYSNLTLRVVDTAASRSVFREQNSTKGRDLIDTAVRFIRSKPDQDVLVVGYKSIFRMKGVGLKTIQEAITDLLTEEERVRVRHVTYGNHTATNEHQGVRNLLLMGLNFRPSTYSFASSAAAQDKALKPDDLNSHPTEADVTKMALGMLKDTTLQALLRGHARKADKGDCGVMEAVILQAAKSGLTDAQYREMFPAVEIVHDTTLLPRKPLKGKLKALADIVTRRMAAGEREMANPDLYGDLGMAKQNFGRLVKNPVWQDWMASMGLLVTTLKGGMLGLRVA